MELRTGEAYARFRCLAGACPDSCCQEWSVIVDPEKAAFYRSLPGTLGDALRRALRPTPEGETEMCLESSGRCPMWRPDGLCRIQAELGEQALCRVCRDFPRLRHDYGDFAELGLELSCPEAARLILSVSPDRWLSSCVPGDGSPDYAPQDMQLLLSSRLHLLTLTADPCYSVAQILTVLLLYGYDVDDALAYGGTLPEDSLSPERYLAAAKALPRQGSLADIFGFYRNLEILTPRWQNLLEQGPTDAPWSDGFRPLIRYFLERYWLQAVSDLDLAARVKFIVLSCLVIGSVRLPLPQAAQLYAKEIENDAENVGAILDGAFSSPAMPDVAILTLIENKQEKAKKTT